MGQKGNPVGLRLCTHNTWSSFWYSDKNNYKHNVLRDYQVRKYIENNLKNASIASVIIKKRDNEFNIVLHSAKPGVIVGKRGSDIERLKSDLSYILQNNVKLDVAEIKKPNASSDLVAKSIAFQLEKRFSFRRVIKRAIAAAMRSNIGGIKVACAGRLSGAEIARTEWYKEGSVPLHKLKADIDYAVAEAHTTYGVIGVKVWIYKGDILRSNKRANVYSKKD